ncbi:MAG: hypothetical protein K2X66_01220 [Cyanobacteria bacterium]|nr:hypothetical protein [Cyanobacteriota bacterium]
MSTTCEIFLGYLGPEGTHSYGVARLLKQRFQVFEALGFSVSLIPCQTLAELMTKTMVGSISLALLPLENALEGSVFEVLETLGTEEKKLEPLLEMIFPITHALIVHPELTDLGSIKTILSHPQALAQCRHTLYEFFGESIQLSSYSSTAQAVQSLTFLETETQSHLSCAALGSPEAAFKYGLKIIKDNVSDVPNNMTRFLLVAGKQFSGGSAGELHQLKGFAEWRESVSTLGHRKPLCF